MFQIVHNDMYLNMRYEEKRGLHNLTYPASNLQHPDRPIMTKEIHVYVKLAETLRDENFIDSP